MPHAAPQNHETVSKHLTNLCQEHQFFRVLDSLHAYKIKMSFLSRALSHHYKKGSLSVVEVFSVSTRKPVQPAAVSPGW